MGISVMCFAAGEYGVLVSYVSLCIWYGIIHVGTWLSALSFSVSLYSRRKGQQRNSRGTVEEQQRSRKGTVKSPPCQGFSTLQVDMSSGDTDR